jgi:DNA modification methylase
MKPYFEANGITLYHGDCRDILPALPRASVHLIVTDPPYGVQWRSNYRAKRFDFIAGDEDQDAAIAGLRIALPALMNCRHVYVFGSINLDGLPLGSVAELIWDKDRPVLGNLAAGWSPTHEPIQFALYVPSAGDRQRGYGSGAARLRRGSVIRVPRLDGNVMRHPTEKPVALLRELIEMSSRIGETVLDPFAGVGSTLVAAQLEGRKAIGIEIEERYCAIAVERLRQGVFAFAADV